MQDHPDYKTACKIPVVVFSRRRSGFLSRYENVNKLACIGKTVTFLMYQHERSWYLFLFGQWEADGFTFYPEIRRRKTINSHADFRLEETVMVGDFQKSINSWSSGFSPL